MDHWLVEIGIERRRADEAHGARQEGRLRTCARRIAGIALAEYRRQTSDAQTGDSFITLLHACALNDAAPEPVRAAAQRLEARIGADFSSPSSDPIGDAEIIVEFVRSAVQKS